MRIISDYRDYYDSAQAYTQGNERVWVRKKDHWEVKWFETKSGWYSTSEYELGVIGFCGQIHIYKHIESSSKIIKGKLVHIPHSYNFEYNPYTYEPKDSKYWFWRTGAIDTWEAVKNLQGLKDIFIDKGVPIFHARAHRVSPQEQMKHSDRKSWHIDYSPCLLDFGFQKYVGHYTAYQEIDMFFNNQLAVSDDPGQITDDVVLRDSKGFDKWTFKKHPTKRR